MSSLDYSALPPDLPVPEDDGAADHLTGLELPELDLPVPAGGPSSCGARACSWPSSTPGPALPASRSSRLGRHPGGARLHPAELRLSRPPRRAGEPRCDAAGISAMEAAGQAAFAERESLPYLLANDAALVLRDELRLPTFEAAGRTLYKRLTFVAEDGRIEKVFYPVFPPDRNAADVEDYLKRGRPLGPASPARSPRAGAPAAGGAPPRPCPLCRVRTGACPCPRCLRSAASDRPRPPRSWHRRPCGRCASGRRAAPRAAARGRLRSWRRAPSGRGSRARSARCRGWRPSSGLVCPLALSAG